MCDFFVFFIGSDLRKRFVEPAAFIFFKKDLLIKEKDIRTTL